jgi:predicted O-methyltransferase YrrM
MIKFFFIISFFLNILLLYFINKKKIKNFLYESKIKKIDITDVDDIFKLNEISNNLSGPKKEAIIKSFSISSNNNIVGMTSDYEAWIISSLSKISHNIFEFGTCSGKTTYLMALNSNENAKITSITLDPKDVLSFTKKNDDNEISFKNIKNESIYNNFLFSGTEVEKKINVLFKNSMEFNEENFKNQMDLIFIDGGHTYSIVKNDSEKAFKMLNSNGIILWHDYVPGKESAKDVVRYIDEISKKRFLQHIKNTSICYYRNNLLSQ